MILFVQLASNKMSTEICFSLLSYSFVSRPIVYEAEYHTLGGTANEMFSNLLNSFICSSIQSISTVAL